MYITNQFGFSLIKVCENNFLNGKVNNSKAERNFYTVNKPIFQKVARVKVSETKFDSWRGEHKTAPIHKLHVRVNFGS